MRGKVDILRDFHRPVFCVLGCIKRMRATLKAIPTTILRYLFLIACGGALATVWTGSAAALFYTDEADWLAAMADRSGLQVVDYGSSSSAVVITGTETYQTYAAVGTGPYTIELLDTYTVPVGPQFRANFDFDFLDGCEGSPNCVDTQPVGVNLTFNQFVVGIAWLHATTNQIDIPNVPEYLNNSFLGYVGPLSQLNFGLRPPIATDDFNLIDLQGPILIATADEPSAAVSLVAGLFIFALASFRWRRVGYDRS